MTDTQIFAVPVNPLPWVVPPVSVIKKGGKAFPKFGQDSAGAAFKEAIKESVIEQGGRMMEPGYSMEILTWRRRDQYQDKAGRTRTKNTVDATNMQKLIEDSLTGIIWEDDRTNITVKTTQIEQAIDVDPMIILILRGGIPIIDGGHGRDNWIKHVPVDVRIEVEKLYTETRSKQYTEINETISNKW